MSNIDILKKQHLAMFDEKRKQHKEIVATLYRKYIADKDIENSLGTGQFLLQNS